MTRPFVRIVVLVAGVLLAAGCGSAAPPPPAPSEGKPVVTDAVLASAVDQAPARSYSPAAPPGARAHVEVTSAPSSTTAAFTVSGLLPSRGYAVHAHVRPCGATGEDAGPHFQNRPDPAATPQKPSSDPAYANPQNEFWFDLRTDAAGNGGATTTVPFGFTDRAPASIVIHEKEMTATAPGQAGTAGGRLACVGAAFR